jgi:putative endonuclease
VSRAKQRLGKWGEIQAARYLEQRGYSIVGHNVRTPYGEIDLVARQPYELPPDGKTQRQMDPVTVFVEVKTRSTRTFGYPEVSVTPRKQAHMLAAAQHFLQEQLEEVGDWRIDVIAVMKVPNEIEPRITHFENVIS